MAEKTPKKQEKKTQKRHEEAGELIAKRFEIEVITSPEQRVQELAKWRVDIFAHWCKFAEYYGERLPHQMVF